VDRPVIALDAMGGDHAPDAVIAGALRAIDEHGIRVVLVGRPAAIEASLRACGRAGETDVSPAADVIGMDEEPALALRAKPDASVRVAAGLVADGRAQAMVSAGSTGATMAAGLFALGRAEGVRRPVVGALLPFGSPGTVLVDAGASADVTAEQLLGHARMGIAYAQALGVATPRVFLLNIGAEPGKGNALAREAQEVLGAGLGAAFAGNMEPDEVVRGTADVVVTDGFTGNVFLKTVEALAAPDGRDDQGGAHGGAAVLLGVKGNVLVAHGAAGEADIVAALRTAERVANDGLAERVAAAMAEGAA
jgi:glycerol-3-phosphate acyltransferase PlsX